MKKLLPLCSMFALAFALSSPVKALVIDAPHNDSNNLRCATCHSYSLWWKYSPTNQSTNPGNTAIVNAICMNCHDGSHEQPWALTHSSTVLGSISHGTWGVGCTDCHNPHFQDQLNWADTGSSPYLVTGTITAVSYAEPPVNQTTITYSGATTNALWPPDGTQSTDPDWANKSIDNPGRGLILTQDTTLRTGTYSIVSASPTQVVIKGRLDANAIDPGYIDPQTQRQNPATCNTFGLIYGQLIKNSIAAKPVKFFDPTGGFVEEGGATTGICQVCHTQTSHFTNNGVLPSGSDSHFGRETAHCGTCHKHFTGFRGDNDPHGLASFAWTGNCAACHNPDNATVEIVRDTHGNTCGICHLNPAGGGPRREGDPANGSDGTAIGAGPSASCLDCHITVPSLTGSGIHHDSAHGYATNGDCTHCHQNASGKLAADHSAAIATSADCVNCHAQTVGSTAGAPVDPADARVHDACTTCHESNGTLKAAYGTASAMPPGGGACENCHGAYFDSHDHGTYGGTVNHTVAVDPVNDLFNYYDPACNGCHSVQNWPNILTTHLGACGTCHNATRDVSRSTPTGTTVQMVIANANQSTVNCMDCHKKHWDMHPSRSDGNCASCHTLDYGIDVVINIHSANCGLCHVDPAGGGPLRAGTDGSAIGGTSASTCSSCHNTTTYPMGFVHHDTPNALNGSCTACHTPSHSGNHTTTVVDSANCNGCHQAAGTTFGVPVSVADNMIHDTCITCHDTDGALLPVAVADNPTTPATVIAMVAGTCEACHGAYFLLHSNPDHSAIHDNGYCGECHPGTPAAAVALHGPCMTCHNPDGTWKLGPTPFPDLWPQVYPGPGACDTCHGDYFTNHISANHAFSVADSSNCVTCHTTTAGTMSGIPVDSLNDMIHDTCATCHNTTTGALRAAYGTAQSMPAGGGTCEACHGDYFTHHAAPDHFTGVAASATCNLSTCHPATDVVGTATGIPVDPANNKVHDACTTCHAANGILLSPYGKAQAMPATGGPCEACHGGYNHPNYVHDMPTVGLCLSCHTANSAPYVASGEAHAQLGCATCHNLTTGITIGSAVGQTNGATCETCHGSFHPPFDHTGVVRANSTTTPTTANCSGCHPATSSPFVGVGQTHEAIGCQGCHSPTDGSLIGSAAGHAGGGECSTCHSTYFNGHTHGSNHDVLMRPTDFNITSGALCNVCHRRGGVFSGNPLFDNSWNGPEGILALHQNSCALCHDSTRTTNVSAGYTSVNNVIMAGVTVGCLDCHADGAGDHPPDPHDFAWEASCQTCHGIGGVSAAAPKGEIGPGVHSNECGLCHLGSIGGNTLIGSAANATWGIRPHICTECHIGGFDSHSHGTGNIHDVLMRNWDLANGSACNTCHRRGGTGSANPLFSNVWSGTDGILGLHQGSCGLCHDSTRTTDIAPPYTSISDVIMAGTTVGCLTCHTSHPDPHNFIWDGNCNSCHPSDYGVDVHNAKCSLCHINPSGGGQRRAGADGDATLGIDGQPRSCLTCHQPTTYPPSSIHHDTPTAATNNCKTCHPSVDHSTFVINVAPCSNCHTSTAGTATGMPVDMADGRIHDSCRTCHTFNPITLAGELIAPTGARGVTAVTPGPCTSCHTAASAGMHHNANAHALIGECEYCHTDPRNAQGGMLFQETAAVPNPIPTHLPCEECHVTPKRGVSPGINGWTASSGQMTIYAYNEGSSHSTTNYSSNFTRTVAHSGGHVIANTVGRINNWGICFSCHDNATAIRVNQFHAKPTALAATNSSCGTTGTSAYAPGREARNTIGNFDFFASTFRPTSTRPGGTGSCRQTGDWTGSAKYGSTIYTASDLVVPDPWSTATNTVPVFPVQPPITTTTPAADNVKVTSAAWDGSNIIVNATNTDGCAALTAFYNGNSQPFAGTTTCTATFAAGVVYTPTVPTLNVTTTNPGGLGVSGFRIRLP